MCHCKYSDDTGCGEAIADQLIVSRQLVISDFDATYDLYWNNYIVDYIKCIGLSYNSSTLDFDSSNVGAAPAGPATKLPTNQIRFTSDFVWLDCIYKSNREILLLIF